MAVQYRLWWKFSSHRQQLVNGRVDNRQAGALQLTSQIFNRGQVFSRYNY